MDVVTVSPKYQVVIPRALREQLKIAPGQQLQAIAYDGQIALIPLRHPRELRGFLKGMDTTIERDDDDQRV